MLQVDYAARLARLRAIAGADVVALVPGANMEYFTGLHFHLSERPIIAFVTADAISFIMPQLEQIKVDQRPDLKASSFIWNDRDGFDGAFQQAAQRLELSRIRLGVDGQTMRVFELFALQEAGAGHIVNVGKDLLDIRAIKTADEVAALQDAIQRSEAALDALLAWVQPGKTEKEIASKLALLLGEHGLSELSFTPLIQTGPNSALPHGMPSERALQANEFMLIDFGGKIDGYPADITRTFVIGEATAEMQRIYETVLAANQAAFRVAGPGVACGDVDKAARDVITEAGYGQYFTHRLGHGLGLEGHELPQMAADVTDTLRPGMVFTIEPGIYVPGLGGVRIEDNVVVTEDGVRSLTSYRYGLKAK